MILLLLHIERLVNSVLLAEGVIRGIVIWLYVHGNEFEGKEMGNCVPKYYDAVPFQRTQWFTVKPRLRCQLRCRWTKRV